MYVLNGAEDSPKSVNIEFRDGSLASITNGWSFYSLATDKVTLNRDQAIQIARQNANNATTAVLNYRNEPVKANLHYISREDHFKAYPFWFVELPLNYPNSTITAWQVGIWADTGEIAYGHPTGVLGSTSMPDNQQQTPNSVPSQATSPQSTSIPSDQNNDNTQLTTYAIAAISIAVISTAIAITVIKRFKK